MVAFTDLSEDVAHAQEREDQPKALMVSEEVAARCFGLDPIQYGVSGSGHGAGNPDCRIRT